MQILLAVPGSPDENKRMPSAPRTRIPLQLLLLRFMFQAVTQHICWVPFHRRAGEYTRRAILVTSFRVCSYAGRPGLWYNKWIMVARNMPCTTTWKASPLRRWEGHAKSCLTHRQRSKWRGYTGRRECPRFHSCRPRVGTRPSWRSSKLLLPAGHQQRRWLTSRPVWRHLDDI